MRRRAGRSIALGIALAALTGAALAVPAPADVGGAGAAVTTLAPSDWRTYGHDHHHTFAGSTSLTPVTARTLAPAWFFPTGDAVTANPIVVGDTVYVGSWDGFFYAIDRADGSLRWKFQVKPQPAVTPVPGSSEPRDVTSDGGLITSSAWFEPGTTGNGKRPGRPDLVIFGGGYTLYALVATGPQAGQLYWEHDYTGLPEQPPAPETDGTRIFSSPVVYRGRVIVGVSADGQDGYRGYVVAADLATGDPIWRFETDVDESGQILNDGCGGVWTSPTLDERNGLVTVGVADCHFRGTPPYHERVLALRVANGSLAWVFTPPRLEGVPAGQDPACDFDIGATANFAPADPLTGEAFLGIGGKDGSYYRIEPATGRLVWETNVVFGGLAGGFIGTTAYDGERVYGATGLGDIEPCDPSDPRDTPIQEPSFHSFDADDGAVAWQQPGSQSAGSTTVAGGMTFVGNIAAPQVQIRDAVTGVLLNVLAVPAPCFCGIAVSGNGVYFGTGAPQQGTGDGVYAYTPFAATPTG